MTDPVNDTRRWLDDVVVGLNLCPFASLPLRDDRVRIVASNATTEEDLLGDLRDELLRLDDCAASKIETTLLVVASTLSDFEDYNQFLDLADALVVACGLEDRFQIASFHPDYRFENTEPDDRSNLTNRSPWPVLHILREQSVSEALARYADASGIYKTNIRTLKAMSESEIRALFSWLG